MIKKYKNHLKRCKHHIKKHKHHYVVGFFIALFMVFSISVSAFKFPFSLADLLSVDENPSCPSTLQEGAIVKVTDFNNNYFTVDKDNNLLYYPDLNVLRTWILNPKNIITINASCFDSLSLSIPTQNPGVNYVPGSYITKHRMGEQLYVFYPGRKLVPITEDVAKYLYANVKGVYTKVNIHQNFWANYTVDRNTSISAVGAGENLVAHPHPGMLINIDGTIYYVYTDGKLREVTKKGFTDNNFQSRFVRKLKKEALANMQYGSLIDSEINAITDQTQTTVYPVDTGTPKLPSVAPTLSYTATDTSIGLNWTKYDGTNFRYYRLVKSTTNQNPVYPGNDFLFKTSKDQDEISFTDPKVKKGSTYYYTICVQTIAKTYLCGKPITAIAQAEAPIPNPPTAPTLTGTTSASGVTLSWNAYSGESFKGYHVVRSTTSTTPKYPTVSSLTNITNASTNTYIDTSVTNSTTYYYSICVEDTYDQVTCSNVVTITTVTPPPPPPPPTAGTTYYIRTDGGSYTQCDGKSDIAYSSSITDKKCALNHPFQLFPPEGSARIAGGDTVVIASSSYKMGLGAPGAEMCSQWYPWDCVMSAIPSGPSKDNPTRIIGAGYLTNSTTKATLWGAERASRIFNLSSANNVILGNLEITDRSQCVQHHSGSIACKRDSYPYGDWAQTGIYAKDSSNVLLKNLDIHGLSDKGIWAGRLTDWTVDNTRIAYNGWVGWDGDLNESSSSNSGTMKFTNFVVEWNGCGETPDGGPIGCWGQSAGGYGDGLGTEYTAGNWIFEDSKFLNNTSDGLDLLYARAPGSSITINRVKAEGNAGNQLKTTGNASIKNSVIVGNCGYFQGKSFTHNVDACRALGNAVSINATNATSPVLFYNNSVYSEGDVLLLGAVDSGSGTIQMRNNIFQAATDYHQSFETSAYTYGEGSITFDQDYNLIYNAKNNNGICSEGTHNICAVDPQYTSVSAADGFNLIPLTTSPVIDKGTTGTEVTTTDFIKSSRPKGAGVDMGAYEVK